MKVNIIQKESLNNYKYNQEIYNKKNKFISQREENILSISYLLLKICLFLLAIISFIKIGHISNLRFSRLKEIKDSYIYEKEKFKKLTNRFDELLSFQGEQRFMKDQDQMISRDIMRVIWR